MSFDLWELEFGVIRVHGLDLFSGGRAEDFDDLDELVNPRFSWE